MNNEKMNQMIDEAYKGYENWKSINQDFWEEQVDGMFTSELGKEVVDRISKECFINECKTNPEFSQKWGLQIEERELSESERLLIFLNEAESLTIPTTTEELDNYEIPTRLITITYNNEKIESYE